MITGGLDMAHNCDTCINFTKYNFKDARKGICAYTDYNIVNMKGKSCPYYRPKKYSRINHKFKTLTKDEIDENRSSAYKYLKLE